MDFPIIETERLLLRNINEEDAEDLFFNFSNPAVMRYYGSEPMESTEEAIGLIHSFKVMFEEQKGVRWGVQIKNKQNLIGTVGFHAISSKHRRAEIGYELNEENWGQGYAREAIGAVVRYGFEQMKLNRIGAIVFLENQPSKDLLRKLGFKQEGVLRNYMIQNGVSYDTNVYSLVYAKEKEVENIAY